jgi:hypothetical protein
MSIPNSHLLLGVAESRASEIRRRTEQRAQQLGGLDPAELRHGGQSPPAGVTIRVARPSDGLGLQRLADLDCARVPQAPVLIAELDERLVAALSLKDGRYVADPFTLTESVVALLRVRAAQIEDERRRGGRLAGVRTGLRRLVRAWA